MDHVQPVRLESLGQIDRRRNGGRDWMGVEDTNQFPASFVGVVERLHMTGRIEGVTIRTGIDIRQRVEEAHISAGPGEQTTRFVRLRRLGVAVHCVSDVDRKPHHGESRSTVHSGPALR